MGWRSLSWHSPIAHGGCVADFNSSRCRFIYFATTECGVAQTDPRVCPCKQLCLPCVFSHALQQDLEARLATVPQTKNGEPVYVPLNADAVKALMIFRSRGDAKGRVVGIVLRHRKALVAEKLGNIPERHPALPQPRRERMAIVMPLVVGDLGGPNSRRKSMRG